jgi:hypothetical protein
VGIYPSRPGLAGVEALALTRSDPYPGGGFGFAGNVSSANNARWLTAKYQFLPVLRN